MRGISYLILLAALMATLIGCETAKDKPFKLPPVEYSMK